jgi:hypothetical protein
MSKNNWSMLVSVVVAGTGLTRRTIAVGVAVVAMILATTVPAYAATATVSGVSDITKMVVNNGDNSLVVKVYGPGGKCAIRWVSAEIKSKNGATYKAIGGCYPGAVWAASLEKGTKVVKCADFRLAYKPKGGFWKFTIPRSCVPKMADKVKVTAELPMSAMPGTAALTKWLARG